MAGTTRQLLHHVSALDGARQPYLVCSPDGNLTDPMPVVVYLHDTLAEPTAEGFIEEAYRTAADWAPVVGETQPLLFVQAFGRGNAGWLGPGGRDLLDLLTTLRHAFAVDEDRIALLGVGGGATGALQLAGWFPHKFSAVAAIGAWSNPQWDLPIGADDWPEWERAQRAAIAPINLAKNLRGFPVYLEHPWWFNGLDGTTGLEHFEELCAAFKRSKANLEIADEPARMRINQQAPENRQKTLRWLLEHRRNPSPAEAHFTAFNLRASEFSWGRIHRLTHPGTPGTVEVKYAESVLRIKTHGVETLEIISRLPTEHAPKRVEIDKQVVLDNGDSFPAVTLERIGKDWRHLPELSLDRESNQNSPGKPFKSTRLAGPPMDLRWDQVLFVAGTLGDQADNRAVWGFLESLRRRWQVGSDSLQTHPGDKSAAIEYPLVLDTEVSQEQMESHHLVLAGHPQCHLLLARFASGLPCQWRDENHSVMHLARKRHDDVRDVAFFLCPNPEVPERYLFVIGVNHASALAHAGKVSTAYLPDYFVHRGIVARHWGFFDSDWRAD
ncbi:MAG: hypothetical protein U1D30_22720 [Planctomycetota bacterium]